MTEHPTTEWINRGQPAVQPTLTPSERALQRTIARNRACKYFSTVSADTVDLLCRARADRKTSMDRLLYLAVTAYQKGRG